MAYGEFANVYDLFNGEADYDALAAHVLRELHQYGISDGIVADLGCGTGELTLRLAAAGYDMIGIDLSSDMLSVLREKAYEVGQSSILLLQQDLTQLDLYGTIRAAVSTFDTLNHLPNEAALREAIARISLFLEPDGIFLFDMNTPYKHAQILQNNTYSFEEDGTRCEWKNTWCEQEQKTQIEISVSYPDGEKYCEQFHEYAYSREEIANACNAAGLKVCGVCDGESFEALHARSERFFFTAVKENAKMQEDGKAWQN